VYFYNFSHSILVAMAEDLSRKLEKVQADFADSVVSETEAVDHLRKMADASVLYVGEHKDLTCLFCHHIFEHSSNCVIPSVLEFLGRHK